MDDLIVIYKIGAGDWQKILKLRKNSFMDGNCEMIYLKIVIATMKTKLQTIRISFWVVLGIALILNNPALNRIQSMRQESTVTPATQTSSSVTTPDAQDVTGSTDWIMVAAVVIVLIVIIPILLKRQVWENGKQDQSDPAD